MMENFFKISINRHISTRRHELPREGEGQSGRT